MSTGKTPLSAEKMAIYRLFRKSLGLSYSQRAKLAEFEGKLPKEADLEATLTQRKLTLRSWRDLLGFWGSIIIIGGSVLLLAVLAFLLFLWIDGRSSDGESATRLWRWITLNQVTTQAITLSSVVLRIVTASQHAICTSLVAGLVLENFGVPLSQVAEVSTTRSVNSGPLRFAWLLLRKLRGRITPTAAMCLLLLLSIAFQFSSTLLVSDLVTVPIVGDSSNTSQPIAMDRDVIAQTVNINWWFRKPSAYVPFGELSSAAFNASPTTSGLSDTGVMKRVFLPFQQRDRATLRRYEGMGFTFHTRHVCIPPDMNVSLNIVPEPEVPRNPIDIQLAGNLNYAQSLQKSGLFLPPDCPDSGCFKSNLNCSLPAFQQEEEKAMYGDFVSVLCIISGLNAINSSRKTSLSEMPVTADSEVFLISRNNGSYDKSWGNATVGSGMVFNLTRDIIPTPQGEWASIRLPNDVQFDFTLCFQQVAVDLSEVAISSTRDLPDAELVWNKFTNTWDTTTLRTMMGTTIARSPIQRGIFQVDKLSNSTTTPNARHYFDMLVADAWNLPSITAVDQNPFMSPVAVGWENFIAQTEFQALFTDTLRLTDRPALALQSVGTAMTSGMVNGFVGQYNILQDATMVSSVSVLVPRHFQGIIVVLAITAVHLVVVALTTVVFLLRTKYSCQGDYWHALAQTVSGETKVVLKHCTQATDEEVAGLLSSGDPEVKIERSGDTGRIQVVKVAKVRS